MMAKNQSSPAKNWCFTWNSPTAERSAQQLVEEIQKAFDCTYVVAGLETAPTTGQRHLQGFLVLASKKRLTALKRVKCMNGAHWEVARGSPQQNRVYCTKESDWFETGELPVEKGKRVDISAIREMVDAGANFKEVLKATTSYQSAKMAQLLIEHRDPPRREGPPTVIWCHGETGSGKSRWAHHGHEGAYLAPGTKWFNGYCGQEVAIFDDFRAGDMPFNLLLRLLDRYPLQVETKGGFAHWYPKKIILTTSLPPELAYGGAPQEDMRQLLRRITEVKAFPLPPDEEAALTLLETAAKSNPEKPLQSEVTRIVP